MYLSLILLWPGAGLVSLNLLLVGFALFVPAPVQFLRARKEGKTFCEAFRTSVHLCQVSTPMIIPRLFR
jgi:protein-S-isoprenylcysteine O-methyltransferase Ste14